MLFNTFKFWLIFPLIFILYWVIPKKWIKARNIYLIVISYFLYMNWRPAFALVLFAVTAITYFGALYVSRFNSKSLTPPADNDRQHDKPHIKSKKYKALVFVFVLLALLPLLIFKYYNFVNDSVYHLFDVIGIRFNLPGLNWAIPVGISFFTFQALGYFFDVYRNKELPERSFIDYMLFCSFFPQTASGPISTASELLPQLKSQKTFVMKNGVDGLKYVLWGIVLKCVIADRLGLYVDSVMSNYQFYSGLNCLIAAVLYSLQIYGDFAGYSLMAIGIAKTLGFDLINNFNRPYFADTISNFWRRWHISLTRWLTRHVYIPLGGSRRSKTRQYGNIMATFLVSGIWHGANYTFIVWGAIHGIAQIAEKAVGIDPKGRHANKKWFLRTKPLRIILTFVIVTFAWIFFRMPSIGDAVNFIARIFTDHSGQEILYKASKTDKLLTFFGILLLFVAELRSEYLREKTKWLDKSWARWCTYVSLFVIILVIGVLDSGSFIYVSF